MWSDKEIAALENYKNQKKGASTIAKLMGKPLPEVEAQLQTLRQNNTQKKSNVKRAETTIHSMWFEQNIHNVDKIATAVGVSPIEVATVIRNLQNAIPSAQIQNTIKTLAGYKDEEVFNKKEPIFWDKKQATSSPMDLIDKLEAFRRAVKGYDTEQNIVTVQLPEIKSDWILQIIIGDLHIGSSETDVTAIRDDFMKIARTPNCYVGFTGDATDNWTKSLPLGIHEQLISPEGQRLIFRSLIDILRNKLLFMVHGCHDNFSITNDDFNLIREVANELKVPYLGYGGKVEQIVNGVMYKGTYWHKRPGTSTTNMFQPCIRTLRDHDHDNDIVTISHNHISGAMMYDYQGRQVALIRTGSYKGTDRYAKKLGYSPTNNEEYQRQIPCVLLNTKHREIRVCQTFDEGIDLLNYLNGTTNTSAATGSDPSGK